MSNWNLSLFFDWNTYQTTPFLGRFSTKTWVKDDGIATPDFIAADIKGGDTITFTLREVNNLAVNISQLVVIFTKQAGAGSEACSPIVWTDPNNSNAKPIPLGMVIFKPAAAAPIPTDGSGWSTTSCPTYPPSVTMSVPGNTTNNAYESTVCVEIWDNSTPPLRGFFTHDPDMDVTT